MGMKNGGFISGSNETSGVLKAGSGLSVCHRSQNMPEERKKASRYFEDRSAAGSSYE